SARLRLVCERRATCTFSSALSVANVAVIWNVRLTPRRQIACGASPRISSPRYATAPSSARSRPARMLKNVDLPAPFGPMSARISPRARSKLTPSTARTPPNALRTPTTRSSGSGTTVADHAKNSAREGQHEQDQDGAEHELPVLRVPRRHRVEELVDRRPPDAREEGDPPAARGERQVVVGERSGEPRGRPDAEQAVVAARDVVPLVDDREGDLGKGEREHREVDGRQAHAEVAVEGGAHGGGQGRSGE